MTLGCLDIIFRPFRFSGICTSGIGSPASMSKGLSWFAIPGRGSPGRE